MGLYLVKHSVVYFGLFALFGSSVPANAGGIQLNNPFRSFQGILDMQPRQPGAYSPPLSPNAAASVPQQPVTSSLADYDIPIPIPRPRNLYIAKQETQDSQQPPLEEKIDGVEGLIADALLKPVEENGKAESSALLQSGVDRPAQAEKLPDPPVTVKEPPKPSNEKEKAAFLPNFTVKVATAGENVFSLTQAKTSGLLTPELPSKAFHAPVLGASLFAPHVEPNLLKLLPESTGW